MLHELQSDALITAALDALPENATENAKRAARDAVVEPRYTVVMVQLGMKKIIEDIGCSSINSCCAIHVSRKHSQVTQQKA